jgi:hypothetical protein
MFFRARKAKPVDVIKAYHPTIVVTDIQNQQYQQYCPNNQSMQKPAQPDEPLSPSPLSREYAQRSPLALTPTFPDHDLHPIAGLPGGDQPIALSPLPEASWSHQVRLIEYPGNIFRIQESLHLGNGQHIHSDINPTRYSTRAEAQKAADAMKVVGVHKA